MRITESENAQAEQLENPRSASWSEARDWYASISDIDTHSGQLISFITEHTTRITKATDVLSSASERLKMKEQHFDGVRAAALYALEADVRTANTLLFNAVHPTVKFPDTPKGKDDQRWVLEYYRTEGTTAGTRVADGIGFIAWVRKHSDISSPSAQARIKAQLDTIKVEPAKLTVCVLDIVLIQLRESWLHVTGNADNEFTKKIPGLTDDSVLTLTLDCDAGTFAVAVDGEPKPELTFSEGIAGKTWIPVAGCNNRSLLVVRSCGKPGRDLFAANPARFRISHRSITNVKTRAERFPQTPSLNVYGMLISARSCIGMCRQKWSSAIKKKR